MSLEEGWRAIQDRHWAVENCLERTGASEGGQRALLEAALCETGAELSTGQHDGVFETLPKRSKGLQ